ncbi:MAG: hypothetical protein PUC88_00270 [Clostridia bacterium]|nr:hypothetical protein [Clostridia bacterium]
MARSTSAKEKQNSKHFGKLKNHIEKNKFTFVIYLVLRFLVIGSMVSAIVRGDLESVFVCVLSLVLFMLPAFVEKNFGIDIPSLTEIIILLFIFSAEILGELQCYYIKVPYWDTMLHTINGFLCAAVGFSLIDILNRNEKVKFTLSPLFLVIVSFCFSMTVGILWEFFEFGCDIFLKTDMQKDTIINSISSVALDPTNSNKAVVIEGIDDIIINGDSIGLGGYIDIGIIDTMKDLFVNMIGAIVFNIFGFFYLKSRGKGKIVKLLIPIPVENESKDKSKKENSLEEKNYE